MYFKLGDGPINYEWNRRHFAIEATDLIYSQSESFEDKKSINIQGAAVSQIAEIKSHKYAFCVIIPPPINKLVYISADNQINTEALRDKIIKATMNNVEETVNHQSMSIVNNQNVKPFTFINNIKFQEANINNSLYSNSDSVPNELIEPLEAFKENVLKNEKDFMIKYENGIRLVIPSDKVLNEIDLLFDLLLFLLMSSLITLSLRWIVLMFVHNHIAYYTLVIAFVIGGLFKRTRFLYSMIAFASSKQACDYIVKSGMIVDCNMKNVYDIITNFHTRKDWDYFIWNYHVNPNNNRTDLGFVPYLTNYPFLNAINVLYSFIKGTQGTGLTQSITQVSFYDSKKNYFIFHYDNLSPIQNYLKQTGKGFFEGYCLSSVDVNKTMILFVTNIDFNQSSVSITKQVEKLQLPYYTRQVLKHERLQILGILKTHLKQYRNVNIEGIMPIAKEGGYLSQNNETLINKKYDQYKLLNKQYAINPKSFLILSSNSNSNADLSIEERFPGYLRYSEGGIECRNYSELRNYDGLMLDLMKRAGKMLLEGKNIIGISLPSKIFEPKSTLVRIIELWGTGPIYLNRAAKLCNGNTIDMMKNIITFVVSGLHMNIKQLKPYNPIVGETYQGYWPDGSQIYLEHISHHPGLSRFLVTSLDNFWKLHGYYEYVACIKGIGNVACGQFKGPTIIDFPLLNKTFEFHYPMQNINGMMYGKRIIEWEGEIRFLNAKENTECVLSFTKQRGFLQNFIETTDTIRGFIKHNNLIISKVFGSPLDSLFFDNELYWSLDKCDLFLPVNSDKCIPSDCRYRPDCAALATGDIALADMEKVKLEVMQRNDKALRFKNKKD